jgi:hypothetical protein
LKPVDDSSNGAARARTRDHPADAAGLVIGAFGQDSAFATVEETPAHPGAEALPTPTPRRGRWGEIATDFANNRRLK